MMHWWQTAKRMQNSSTNTFQAPTKCNLTREQMPEWSETWSAKNAVIHPTITAASHRHWQRLNWRQHWVNSTHTKHRVVIKSELIINLGSNGMTVLLKLINIIWKTGHLPKDWKTALLIPLLKKNKSKRCPSSYRPIQFTSCFGTLVGRMINDRLNWWLEHNITTPCQAGFRSNYTIEHQLIRLTHKIKMDSKWSKTRLVILKKIIWQSLEARYLHKDERCSHSQTNTLIEEEQIEKCTIQLHANIIYIMFRNTGREDD